MTNLIKKNKKIFFLLITIFFIFIAILTSVFVNWNKNVQKAPQDNNFQKITLSGFTVVKDFKLSNNINIPNTISELFYIKDFEEIIINLRNLAQKYGLTRELFNEVNQNYRWVKNNFRDQDFIYLDYDIGFFEINYTNGLIQVNGNPEDILSQLKELLGFRNFEIQLNKLDKVGEIQVIKYKVIYKNKTVYFDQGISDFLTVYIVKNQINYISGYLFSTYLSNPTNLKPLEYVGPENISFLDYRFYISLDDFSSSSSMGVEKTPYYPLNIGFRNFKEEAFFVYKNKESNTWMLLPIVVIESNFLDAGNQRGTLDFIVLNQSP